MECEGFSLRYSQFEMPSWWGGRLKALRRIPARDIVDAVVVSLFLFVMSTLVVVPVVIAL